MGKTLVTGYYEGKTDISVIVTNVKKLREMVDNGFVVKGLWKLYDND